MNRQSYTNHRQNHDRNPQRQRRTVPQRRGIQREWLPGAVIAVVFLAVIIIFMVMLARTGFVPAKYLGIVCFLLLNLAGVAYILMMRFRKRKLFVAGTSIVAVMVILMGAASIYITKTVSSLDKITGVDTVTTAVNVYVKQDDPVQDLSGAASYSFGILSALDRDNTDAAVKRIDEKVGKDISTTEYTSLTELADSLMKGDCQAIVLNSAYLEVLSQMDNYTSFPSQVRQIAEEKVEQKIADQNDDSSDKSKDQSQEEQKQEGVYTIYISGIDTRGTSMISSSLSDVNLILTVNANTHQVLMISTPRDYYVPLSISGGAPDKLTHAGIYGVDVCMDTLDMLYGIHIDYYFRLNFSGFIQIIDQLGGITVYSDYDFDSKNVEGYHFNKGENQLNGEQALAFSRERYSFDDGDRQRGRNQMAVVQGVVDKITSPELLKSYLSILDSLAGCFETNIPYDLMAQLVREQLDKGGSWEVLSYSVNGTGDTQKPYSMSQPAYVMVPDQATVDKAKSLMEKVRGNTKISEADLS